MAQAAAEINLGILRIAPRGGIEVQQSALVIALQLKEQAALQIELAVRKIKLQGPRKLRGCLLVPALLAIRDPQALVSQNIVRVQPQGVAEIGDGPVVFLL